MYIVVNDVVNTVDTVLALSIAFERLMLVEIV